MTPRTSERTPKTIFARRLKILLNDENFSSFESKCGLTANSIMRYYDGQSPKLEALQSIILATGCNADWLITGRGEPFTEQGK